MKKKLWSRQRHARIFATLREAARASVRAEKKWGCGPREIATETGSEPALGQARYLVPKAQGHRLRAQNGFKIRKKGESGLIVDWGDGG